MTQKPSVRERRCRRLGRPWRTAWISLQTGARAYFCSNPLNPSSAYEAKLESQQINEVGSQRPDRSATGLHYRNTIAWIGRRRKTTVALTDRACGLHSARKRLATVSVPDIVHRYLGRIT